MSAPLHHKLASALCSLLASVSTVSAADFLPILDIGTNMTDGNSAGNPLSNIIEGSGIGFAATEPHAGPSAVWYTDAPGGFPSDYVAVHAGPEYLWFDLGADVSLSEISFWGYSTGNANGVKGFNLTFATDAEGGAAGLGDESYGTSVLANPAFEAVLDNVPRQSFPFSPVVARYVQVEVTSTHITNGGSGPPAGGDRVGVGEFAFEEITIDPDPQISVPSEIALSLTTSVDVFDIPVSNVGAAELTITSASFVGPNALAFSVPSFPSSIPSLGADIIEVQFNPAGLVGPVSATLQIVSNDPDTSPAEILFTGIVPPIDADIIVPGPIDRGNIADIDRFDVAVSNGGGNGLTITSAGFVGPNAAAFSILSGPVLVPGLGTDTFQIQIDATGLVGAISATFQIASNDPETPLAEVEITAEALGPPAEFYPIAAVQSSTSANDFWPAANLIQGSGTGFQDVQPHDKILSGEAGNWVTAACGFPCDYIATTGTPILIFDLGQDVPLCEISVWGYEASNSNGASEFSLRFASESDGSTGFGTSITFNPTFAGQGSGELPNGDSTSRFSFLFGTEITARYVEMTCLDNHFIAPGDGSGGEIPGGDRVGLGEVAFEITDCEAPTLFFDVAAAGDTLVFTWESRNGQLFNLRSEVDPASGEPITWPVYDGHGGMTATPPMNTLTIPRPADPFRLFVIESFPTPPVVVFADNFESGQGLWTTGNDGSPGTNWELGAPVPPAIGVGPATAASPTNCWGTNLAAGYAILANAWLRSPPLDLGGAAEATLIFSRFVDIEQGFDFGTISVLDAATDAKIVDLATAIDGLSTDWEAVRLPLPAVALDRMIKIEFRLESDDFIDPLEYAGFYIDDVSVTTR